MTIELKEGVHYYKYFFIPARHHNQDVMGMIFKPEGEPVQCKFRFRYYADDKVFDSEDKKSWHHITGKDDTDPEVFCDEVIEAVFKKLSSLMEAELEVINIDGDHEQARFGLLMSEHTSMKQISKEEYEEKYVSDT